LIFKEVKEVEPGNQGIVFSRIGLLTLFFKKKCARIFLVAAE
jgi:hypothetical protein